MINVDVRLIEEFWRLHPEAGAELRAQIEALAPPPQEVDVRDDAQVRRWVAASYAASAISIDQFGGLGEREQRAFAWSTARVLFGDPETFPMDA